MPTTDVLAMKRKGRQPDELERIIGWQGRFEGHGAFPIKNRALTAALEDRGWEIIPNTHTTHDGDMTPYFVSCLYPPRSPSVEHARSLCISTWEFDGPGATPRSFLSTFQNYDVVWGACQFAADVFAADGADNAVGGRLGVDGHEFNPDGDRYPLEDIPPEALRLLWVGGTDERHSFDLVLELAGRLPHQDFWIIAKQHPDYPPQPGAQEGLTLLREPMDTLAPLYRACDVFIHPARATGTSMPVMEALACGLDVVSTDLPSVREYGEGLVHFIPGERGPMRHHLHHDSTPQWREPDLSLFIAKLYELKADFAARALNSPEKAVIFAEAWSWDAAAASLEEALLDEENDEG